MADDVQGDLELAGGGEYDLDYSVMGNVYVGNIEDSADTTVNMLPGGYVRDALVVSDTGILNVFGGTCDWLVSIASDAVINVYGTNYQVDGEPVGEGVTEVYMPLNELAWVDGDGNDYSLFICSDVMVQLPGLVSDGMNQEPEVINVEVDIKPDSSDNAVNLRSKGVVPVAFVSNETFDATRIDFETVTVNGNVGLIKCRGKKQRPMVSETDVNGDGLVDLLVKLDTQMLADAGVESVCEFTATTYDGMAVRGSDSITVVGRK
ncbi:hypothetical protein [Anaerohalosphaera lusitana]|nr:hypothetical protein [Anaerohalosphaera lusitana]